MINAAGCWAPALGRMVGVDIPITVQRNQVALLRQPRELLRRHCVVADIGVGMYFRPEETVATMVGTGDGEDGVNPDAYNEAVDKEFPPFARHKASQRAPVLNQAVSRGGWSGIYDMTPDGKAILGQAGPEGFYLACGLSRQGSCVDATPATARNCWLSTGARWLALCRAKGGNFLSTASLYAWD